MLTAGQTVDSFGDPKGQAHPVVNMNSSYRDAESRSRAIDVREIIRRCGAMLGFLSAP